MQSEGIETINDDSYDIGFESYGEFRFDEFDESDGTVDFEAFNTFVASEGQRIEVWRNNQPLVAGSIGYRASLNGQRGFVTVAHLGLGSTSKPLQGWDRIHLPGGGEFGVVADSRHVSLNNIDAAFVTLFPGFEITNIMGVPDGAIVFVGHQVHTNGGKTGFRSGTVLRVGET